jgi:hypothetical protein
MKTKFTLIALLLAVAARAQTNSIQLVEVVNTNALPVNLSDLTTQNVLPSFGLGFGFGMTVCGFGWIVRMALRVAGPDNS